MAELLDTTLRPLCFPELGRAYTPEQAKTVGPDQFKKYEYVLYLMAQLSRIVYCDTGVQWEVIKKGLGLSNDVVNKLITYYDSQYASDSKTPLPSPPGLNGRPMKSYAVKGQPATMPSSPNFGTYISTGHDVTCLILDAAAVKPNLNSIITSDDVIVTFKGSSTIQNFIDDAKSMVPTDFSAALKQIDLDIPNLGKVANGFVFPLLHAFKPLMEALAQRLEGKESPRVFITGHSLGGAYATLFGWILALMKKNGFIQSVKSLHTVTYGAPTLFSDTARNQYNSLLDEGLLTLDRVVSQKIQSVKMVGSALVGADFIPTIPPGFSHPGFQPLITEFFPEKNGRPYGLQNIRGVYGVTNPQSYRNSTTWPFDVPAELGNIGKRTNLASIVSGLTGATASQVAALPTTQVTAPTNTITTQSQQGGLFGFGEEKTKYEELTKKHIPNFVSVVGSNYAVLFPHAEYLGMFFAGAMRMAGRKNPVPTGDLSNTATFFFTPQGVDIQYNFKKVKSNSSPTSPTNVQPTVSGGRRRKQTRKHKKSKKRHTRKH
jgi:hypothetical protein